MRFSTEVEVWSNRVFKQLYDQVAGQQQRHRSHDCFSCASAIKSLSPDAHAFGNDFDEDRCQHEAGAQRHQVFQEAFTEAMRARSDEHKASEQICAHCEQTKNEKADKSSGLEVHSLVIRQGIFGRSMAQHYTSRTLYCL